MISAHGTDVTGAGSGFSCDVNDCSDFKDVHIVSYNMHGFNQGSHTVRDLILYTKPDVFLLQEHWLTPAGLSKFESEFPQYICFGSSAMSSCVDSGIIRGRPFGGVMTLVNRSLSACCKVICASDRFVIVTVGNLLIINLYMPCSGSVDRLFVFEEVLISLSPWIQAYPAFTVVVGGDINSDLDEVSPVSNLFNRFATDLGLVRCDTLLHISDNMSGCGKKQSTYYNDHLHCESTIDYFLVSSHSAVSSFDVLDIDSNLSDHRPIAITCESNLSRTQITDAFANKDDKDSDLGMVRQLRWDHADLLLYYNSTGLLLQSILDDLMTMEKSNNVTTDTIDRVYYDIVNSLLCSSEAAVPTYKKNFFRFWWDEELKELKDKSIASCRMWKTAGKPRSGPIFDSYRKDKSAYKKGIRFRRRSEDIEYTNSLHESLLEKQGTAFWKC